MDEWIEHDGKGLPVPPETPVLVKARNGYDESGWASPETAAFWDEDAEDGGWTWVNGPGDIMAYTIITDEQD